MHRDEEDAEDVVALAFEFRPRLVIVPRGPEQLLERALVDRAGAVACSSSAARVEQVDPAAPAAISGQRYPALGWN